jgi:outer membrane protein OmpA-like peptidoglycan-associated protein
MITALDDLASRIAASPGHETLTLVGHTDSVGTDAYNQGLSERRAHAVAKYLMGKGIDINSSDVSGAGEKQPIADNGTRDGRPRTVAEIATR